MQLCGMHVCTSEPLDCTPKPQWQVCMSVHLNPWIVPLNPSDKCACLHIWTLGLYPQTPVTSVHVCTSEPLDCTPKPQWQVCMSISLNPGLYPQTPVTCVHVCTSEPLDCIPKPQWQVCMSAHLNPGIVPWNPSDKCACLYIWTLGFCPQTPVTSRQNWYMYNITKLQNWHGAYNTMWTTQSHFLTSVITKPVWNFPDLIGYTNL